MTNFPDLYFSALHWADQAAFFACPPLTAPREATFFAATALGVLRGDRAEPRRTVATQVLCGLLRHPPRRAVYVEEGTTPVPPAELVVLVPPGEMPHPMPVENGRLLEEMVHTCRHVLLPPDMVAGIIEFALARPPEEAHRLTQAVVNHPAYVERRQQAERGQGWGAATEKEWREAMIRVAA